MKITLSLTILLLLASCMIGSGENSKIVENKSGFFPQIVGIDLEGEKRQLPQSFDKKLNIVVVAFKREQQENVNGWIKVADEILAKNSEIGFYEVPLIYKLNGFSRTFINNGMRRGIPDIKARKRTITVYTDRKKFFEMMKMREDKIYLLVLDRDGKILQQIEGDAVTPNIKQLNIALGKN